MSSDGRQRLALAVIAIGIAGLAIAAAAEAYVAFDSGLWYPVVYAGIPSLAAAAAFARERPKSRPLILGLVGGWILVSSVFALALTVVLAVGTPPTGSRPSGIAFAAALALYLAFLLVPVGAATAAARRTGVRTVVPLVLSPVAQIAIGAVLALAA